MTIGCCPLKYYGLTSCEVVQECVTTLNNVLSNLMPIHFTSTVLILSLSRLIPIYPTYFYSCSRAVLCNLMESIRVWPHNLPNPNPYIPSSVRYLLIKEFTDEFSCVPLLQSIPIILLEFFIFQSKN